MNSLVWMMLAAGLRLDGVTGVDPQALADGALRPDRPIVDGLGGQVQALSRLPDGAACAGLGPNGAVSAAGAAGERGVEPVVDPVRRWRLDARADNHGNRHTGRPRGCLAGQLNGLLVLGDRLTVSGGGNGGQGWEGGAAYQFPLGRRGTRIQLTGGHHHHEFGGEFAPLLARGEVDSAGVMAMAPLTTVGSGHLTWELGVEGRRMRDAQRSAGIEDQRRALAMTTGLRVLAHPAPGTAAWGGVWAEIGDLRFKDAASTRRDRRSARTAGQYLVLSAEVALLRQWESWGLMLRGSGQIADRKLDRSRKFALGGARSVRAWPLGETAGDHGALVQAELRYRWQSLEPFGFFDAGRVRFQHTPWDMSARGRALPKARALTGAGVGVRWRHGPWGAEGSAGWRLAKETWQRRSFTDPRARTPQLWVSVSYSL